MKVGVNKTQALIIQFTFVFYINKNVIIISINKKNNGNKISAGRKKEEEIAHRLKTSDVVTKKCRVRTKEKLKRRGKEEGTRERKLPEQNVPTIDCVEEARHCVTAGRCGRHQEGVKVSCSAALFRVGDAMTFDQTNRAVATGKTVKK